MEAKPTHYFVIFSEEGTCSPVRRFRDLDAALAGFHAMAKDPFYLEQPATPIKDASIAGVSYTDGRATLALEAQQLTRKDGRAVVLGVTVQQV